MRRAVAVVILSLTLAKNLFAQEERRDLKSWPRELYTCVSDGPAMTFKAQFALGKSEILLPMQAELQGKRDSIQAHAVRPNTCFLVYGAADTTRWRGERIRWVNDRNDAAISLARAEAIGNLVGREFALEPGRVQVGIIPAELPRNTAIVLGHFFRADTVQAVPAREPAREEVRPEAPPQKVVIPEPRDSAREKELERRIGELEKQTLHAFRLNVAPGIAYDYNRGYRMPQLNLAFLVGTKERTYAEFGMWHGRSLNESRSTFTNRGSELSSKLFKWGYGGRVVAYPFARFTAGPMIEYFKYETVIKALGEFSETKRGSAIGIFGETRLSIFQVAGSLSLGWNEVKEAGGVGGFAKNNQNIRGMVGIRFPLIPQTN